MNLIFYILIGFLAAFSPALQASETISGSFRTYVGRSLSPEEPATALTFEPAAAVIFPSATTLSFLATIDRPTNKYENFQVPRLRTRVKQGLGITNVAKISTELTAAGVDVHRWSNEGAMLRTSAGLVAEKRIFNEQLLITLKASPFYQFNSYRQTTDGQVKPEYGVAELVGLELRTGRTTISADIQFQQTFHSLWKNGFATSQEIAYNFTDNWSVGAGHQLLGSFIDASTGRSSPLKLYDSRQSQVSAFLGYEF